MAAGGLPSTSLHELAAALGHDGELEALISAGVSTEERDEQGWTPLHVAMAVGNEQAVHTLLTHGADVRAKDLAYLRSPLHFLVLFGDHSSASKILHALLSHVGAAATAELLIAADIDGVTPFHLAAEHDDARILKGFFREYHMICASSSSTDVDIDHPPATISDVVTLQTDDGRTPLHFAAAKGNLETVCALLEAGASKHVRDARGVTPFHLAASAHSEDITEILEVLQLENVNDAETLTQDTALHFAARSACIQAVRWLLAHGALVDAVQQDGYTPLHIAAMQGNSLVIEGLVEGGANPQHLTSKAGEMALGLADEFGCHDAAKEFVKAIKQSGEDKVKDALWAAHKNNGATVLHFFAAYGTEDDLRWILALIQRKTVYHIRAGDPVNRKDKMGRTAVHWAAMRSNIAVVSVLAEHKADLNAQSNDKRYKTPLSITLMNGEIGFAEELLKWKPKTSTSDNWLRGIRTWMRDYYLDEDKALSTKLANLKDAFKKYTNVASNHHSTESLFAEIPPLYLALHAKREDIASFIQRHSKGVEDAVNEKGEHTGRIALHWATLLRQREVVAQLCRVEVFARELTANAEDKHGKTALQYAKEMKLEDIEKELMLRSDVKSSVDGMYKDRQVYVDAANAILVGAALIAGVTFAGWLQPPLSYTPYYNLPELPPPSPPSVFQAYAAVQQHMGVRLFWIFNSLSFSFAIATMIAGLVAVVPIPGTYIATSVAHLRRCLLIASALLSVSIVFVLAAFAAAGFAVLPPVYKYQANMMATVIVGGIPCVILLAWFAYRLWSLRPEWLRAIETRILRKRHRRGSIGRSGQHLARGKLAESFSSTEEYSMYASKQKSKKFASFSGSRFSFTIEDQRGSFTRLEDNQAHTPPSPLSPR